MTEQMHALGKERIKAENEKLRPILENMLKRKESKENFYASGLLFVGYGKAKNDRFTLRVDEGF
jgi:hypothetical protein